MKTLLLMALFANGFEQECSRDMYPDGLRKVSGTYEQYNDGYPFGESTNTSFLLNINTMTFVSLSGFSLPHENTRRRIVFENAPTNYNLMGSGLVSVSRCPGDFVTATCVMPVNNGSTLFITTKPNDPPHWCHVDKDKEYFINYILTDDLAYPPSCANMLHRTCAMFYTEAL